METSNDEKQKVWETTNVTNLLKNSGSGRYYARVRIRGKLKWRSLGTTKFSVAKLKLADAERELRGMAGRISGIAVAEGETLVGPFIRQFLLEEVSRKPGHKSLGPATKKRRETAIKALIKTWPGLDTLDVRRITEADCEAWAKRAKAEGTGFVAPGAKTKRAGMSASAFNKCLDALRSIFEAARESGYLYVNPAAKIGKQRLSRKRLEKLPNDAQFAALVKAVAEAGARQSKDCADMVRLLAYSGLRLNEATALRWHHVNEDTLTVPGTKTDSSDRTLPLFRPLRALFSEIRARRGAELPEAPILGVSECKGALRTACKAVGIPKLGHHDLRHLFATRCLQLGIDASTIAKWLGHSDGGALVLKTYGHVTSEHAERMAAKVSFGAG